MTNVFFVGGEKDGQALTLPGPAPVCYYYPVMEGGKPQHKTYRKHTVPTKYGEATIYVHESIPLDKVVERIVVTLLEMPQSVRWLPIEIAPGNRKVIVIGGEVEPEIGGDYPNTDGVVAIQEDGAGRGWRVCNTVYYSAMVRNPTHWMPIPGFSQEPKTEEPRDPTYTPPAHILVSGGI